MSLPANYDDEPDLPSAGASEVEDSHTQIGINGEPALQLMEVLCDNKRQSTKVVSTVTADDLGIDRR